MSQQAVKFRIGLFLFLAAALFVGSLFFFGLTSFFQQRTTFVSFFNESVMGLNKGSFVRFRGVEIGQVTDIRLSLDDGSTPLGIPVIYEIDVSRLQDKLGVPVNISEKGPYENAIRDGLSAKLSNSSFVTGQLYVDLNFRPNSVKDPTPRILDKDLHMVPAVPSLLADVSSQMVKIVNDISQINFPELSTNLNQMIVNANQILDDFEKQGTVKNVNSTLASVQELLNSGEINKLLKQVGGAAGSLDEMMTDLNTGKGSLGQPLADTLKQLADTTTALNEMSQNFAQLIESNTGPVADIERTLGDIQEATTAFQSLLEFLRRHPNALIFGKQTP